MQPVAGYGWPLAAATPIHSAQFLLFIEIHRKIPEKKQLLWCAQVKFMFSKKAAKIEKIFTVYLTLGSKCQNDGEDFVNFCGLLSKQELY